VVKVRVLRVFTNEDHAFGNPVGVIEDGGIVRDPTARQAIAAALGYSESVFIDDVDDSMIHIYSGRREVPFAGHAAVGAAWFLAQVTSRMPDFLRAAGGVAPVWTEGGITWVRSSLASTPPWWHERLSSPAEVDALTGPLAPVQDMTQLWAWEDEAAGTMRVRTFASRVGITEDEACGSGAMRMAAAFGRRLTLHHGRGSIVHAKPGPPGYADIGGRVTEDSPRTVRGPFNR
jgi:predicted PhzF superfamily epimerase YddE/YHI9